MRKAWAWEKTVKTTWFRISLLPRNFRRNWAHVFESWMQTQKTDEKRIERDEKMMKVIFRSRNWALSSSLCSLQKRRFTAGGSGRHITFSVWVVERIRLCLSKGRRGLLAALFLLCMCVSICPFSLSVFLSAYLCNGLSDCPFVRLFFWVSPCVCFCVYLLKNCACLCFIF